MNKIAVIEWLAGYINPPSVQDDDAIRLASTLRIELEEAQEMVAECEARLIKTFDAWKDDILDKNAAETKNPIHLSPEKIFDLGFAYGSFSVSQIDQGLHIVLPCTTEAGVLENAIFKTLFTEYFDLIPADLEREKAGDAYMGAIQAFVKEEQLGLVGEHFITAFEEVKINA